MKLLVFLCLSIVSTTILPDHVSVALRIGYQLVIAAKAGDVNVIEQLLVDAAPADLSFSVPGDRPELNFQYQLAVGATPMIEACRGGYVRIVKILVAADPDMDLRVADSNGDTAISVATKNKNAYIILALLKIDTGSPEARVPHSHASAEDAGNFMAACQRDDLDAITALLALSPRSCSHDELARAILFSAAEG